MFDQAATKRVGFRTSKTPMSLAQYLPAPSNDFFKPIGSIFTIRQKIHFAVYKYEHNYFVGLEPDEIDNLPDEILRPLRKITKDNLNRAVSRDQRAKTKKLAWVMRNLSKSKFSSFLDQLDTFTSVSAAERAAAKLFSEHNKDYSVLQATVKSVAGERRVMRRNQVPESALNRIVDATADGTTSDTSTLKKQLLDDPQVEKIRHILGMKPKESQAAMAEDSEDISYALGHVCQPEHRNLINHSDRQTVLMLAHIHQWIAQK